MHVESSLLSPQRPASPSPVEMSCLALHSLQRAVGWPTEWCQKLIFPAARGKQGPLPLPLPSAARHPCGRAAAKLGLPSQAPAFIICWSSPRWFHQLWLGSGGSECAAACLQQARPTRYRWRCMYSSKNVTCGTDHKAPVDAPALRLHDCSSLHVKRGSIDSWLSLKRITRRRPAWQLLSSFPAAAASVRTLAVAVAPPTDGCECDCYLCEEEGHAWLPPGRHNNSTAARQAPGPPAHTPARAWVQIQGTGFVMPLWWVMLNQILVDESRE